MNQPFNPYQHNVDIVRGFFRKPVVLLTAIVYCLPNIFAIILPFVSLAVTLPYYADAGTNSGFKLSVSFDIAAILFAIAFFILFFKARSRKPYVKLNAGVTLTQVCSIIYAVLSGIAIAVFLILTICLFCFSSQMPENVFKIALILAGITLANSVADFLFYFAFSRFAKGVKYSLTTVFLTKKGSIFTVVAGLIYIAVKALVLFMMFNFLDGILEAMYYLCTQLPSFEDLDYNTFISTLSDLINVTLMVNVVQTAVNLLPVVFVVIVAFMYHRYIKKATTELILTPADNEATRFYTQPQPAMQGAPQPPFNQNGAAPFVPPVQDFRQQPTANPTEQHIYENPYSGNSNPPQNNQYRPQTPPQDFVPQPVFNNSEKSDNTNQRDNQPSEIICSFCGEKLPPDTKFCPKCGQRF